MNVQRRVQIGTVRTEWATIITAWIGILDSLSASPVQTVTVIIQEMDGNESSQSEPE